MSRPRCWSAPGVIGVLFTVGCGAADSTTPLPPAAARVTVEAPALVLASGTSLALTAAVYTADGRLLRDRTLAWSSSNTAIATVDAAGVVTAASLRGAGADSVVVRATVGAASGAVQLTVRPVPVARVEIAPSTPTVRIGQDIALTATLRGSDGIPLSGRTVEWESLSPAVISVSSSGVVTGVGPGTAEVRAVAEGLAGSVTVTVPPLPTVSLTVSSATYPVRGDSVTLSWTAAAATTCEASGSWSGPQALQGSRTIGLSATGTQTFRLVCTGTGGSTTRESALLVRLPVLPTSYANFKTNGVMPTWLPRFNDAPAHADFRGDGRQTLFTAPMRYDPTRPIEDAGPGLFEFWQPTADRMSWTPLTVTVVQEAPNCMHPRMAVVTDVNADRRPDLYVLCHGYDAFPFPGERSMVLVSQTDGTYRQRYFSSRVAFYHGGAACDLDGDRQPELITADGAGVRLWKLGADGRGTIDTAHPLSQLNGQYYTAECLDVDGNGTLDVIVGGHEPPTPPLAWAVSTSIVFDAGTRTPTTRTIPGMPTDPVVLDFTVTGTGATRALWVLRTALGYVGSVLQRVDLATFNSTVARRGPEWFPRLLPYERDGVHYLGTNALGRGWEMPYVP